MNVPLIFSPEVIIKEVPKSPAATLPHHHEWYVESPAAHLRGIDYFRGRNRLPGCFSHRDDRVNQQRQRGGEDQKIGQPNGKSNEETKRPVTNTARIS